MTKESADSKFIYSQAPQAGGDSSAVDIIILRQGEVKF